MAFLFVCFSDKRAVAALQIICSNVKEPAAFKLIFVNDDVSTDFTMEKEIGSYLKGGSISFLWCNFTAF